ncbi:hypothetical protein OQX61_14945 [Pedobacter sp. PLR]|uniref:hypothetical protein n=1 Tax=Pedobacter sp. PLR TaxID=2994465 RepID=UPI002247ECC4|nr:hypothetical protein [Pedobacter sp. PLR]MCX2452572.1 hypothetical protein [Pedobacter sp. PLR]
MHSEQAENPLFFQLLDICCQKIAEAVGDKQIYEWTNSDFVRLSGLLQRKTKVQLSESTLKRIFGKSKTSTRYYPQKATRDALARFIGCRDWYEFELRNTVSIEKSVAKTSSKSEASPVVRKTALTKKGLLYTVFLVFAAIIAFLIFRSAPNKEQDISRVELSCLNPEGQTPHSAIFKLKAAGELPDSLQHFTINFSDVRWKTADFRDSLVNHYYEVPGRYYPVLYHKKKALDTGYVYLQTKGWTATASVQNDTTRVYPILGNNLMANRPIKVSARAALSAGTDTTRTFFVAFANVKPSRINGDNFELSGNFTTSPIRAGVRCSQVDIFVFGEKDKHSLGIIKPECAAWTFYQFSEHSKEGQKYDLRPLGHDLTKGGHVQLRVADKKVSLMINGSEVFKTSYNKPIGKIMGVKIIFAGIGQFDNFKLADLKTKEEF